MIKKNIVPIVTYIISFYVISFILVETMIIKDGIALGLISLALINGISVFFSSYYMGKKYGMDFIHLLFMIVLFIGSALVIFNNSAISYVYFYLILGFGGVYLGSRNKK